ncbi:MAG: hypothetical protein DWQ42_01350 [Planctomycetota bacterium]|nr:MAG: hypothetical protein DWQ42_01350 [Planctomycetota bacterium]REK38224.1 MAG: hypothetical protein DWQ46_21085 [Planctomycetota bacterium]
MPDRLGRVGRAEGGRPPAGTFFDATWPGRSSGLRGDRLVPVDHLAPVKVALRLGVGTAVRLRIVAAELGAATADASATRGGGGKQQWEQQRGGRDRQAGHDFLLGSRSEPGGDDSASRAGELAGVHMARRGRTICRVAAQVAASAAARRGSTGPRITGGLARTQSLHARCTIYR